MAKKEDPEYTPYDCTPGTAYDKRQEDLLNVAAGNTDDRGWSLADHLLGTDEGGPNLGAALMPPAAQAADLRKAQGARRKRMKDSYALIMGRIEHANHKTFIQGNHFQDGFATIGYLQANCQALTDALTLRDHNKDWDL